MDTGNYTLDYRNFDSKAYLETASVLFDEHGNENKLVTFLFKEFHNCFKDGIIRGKRLLDLGTGPTIASIISASHHFDEIYLSDVAPQNLSVLEEWWQGRETYTTGRYFKPMLKYCIDLSDGRQSVEELNRSIREKIKGILLVDVRKQQPFYPNRFAPFDAITSRNCLDAACTDDVGYANVLHNTSKLLKKGGSDDETKIEETNGDSTDDYSLLSCLIDPSDIFITEIQIYKKLCGLETQTSNEFYISEASNTNE
ncbi:hypothetical protein ScPMuIL_001316 [Solemya velum]